MYEEKKIGQKRCFCYHDENATRLLIQPVDAHDLEQLNRQVELIKKNTGTLPFTLVAFLVDNWNDDLSPWAAPAVFGTKNFGGGALKTLEYIETVLLPELLLAYESIDAKSVSIGGYSLAGLFALWAAYQTNRFFGVAAVSPSVWFPGWADYILGHAVQAKKVYLSLGDKEEKAKNPIMAQVGANIRRQYEVLTASLPATGCVLEWNAGNHFQESAERTAKGFAWICEVQEDK